MPTTTTVFHQFWFIRLGEVALAGNINGRTDRRFLYSPITLFRGI